MSLTDQAQAMTTIAGAIAHRRPLSAADLGDLEDHPYIVTGDLARWLVENRHALSEKELADFFNAVELQLEAGNEPVRELLAEGILEDLRNLSRARGVPEEAWFPHLQPRT
jgi:hypothetical protein